MNIFGKKPESTEAPAPVDFSNVTSGSSTTAPPAAAPAPERRTYVVVSGDSLWKIAKHVYGNGNRWPLLYQHNRDVIGNNPDKLRPGQVLNLPDDPQIEGDKA